MMYRVEFSKAPDLGADTCLTGIDFDLVDLDKSKPPQSAKFKLRMARAVAQMYAAHFGTEVRAVTEIEDDAD